MTQQEEILQLREENKMLVEQNNTLRLRIAQLESLLRETLDKLNKNSQNSSKPPSSDMVRKTQSLRIRSGKKPGGQMGHKGTTLEMSNNPDHIEVHNPERCSHCQGALAATAADSYERRQVYELPPLKIMVTEHRCVTKTCPYCGWVNKGAFPGAAEQPTQYGPGLQTLGVYLTQYQFLSYERCAQLMEDLLGHRPSEGWLVTLNERCAAQLPSFEHRLKQCLLHCDVLHVDETGYYFGGKRNWLHVVATTKYTYYCAHQKRGAEALEDMDILEHFGGVAMHDYWPCYLDYNCDHVFCHAHHLRDLNFCIEAEKSHWAEQMKALLVQMKQSVEEERQKGGCCLSAEVFGRYHTQYWKLLEEGEQEHSLPQKQQGSRGKTAKSKSRNLLERFVEHASEMLRFGCDFSIPFSNNIAEQALRMMKVKQNISGCFRSREGAQGFAVIRSYIDTVRKQGLSIWEWLKEAILGAPWLPLVPAPA
jgi:transposase